MGLYDQYLAEANNYIALYGLTGAHNGNADAFRHAYVSAAMTQDYGSVAANLAGQANELRGDWNGQPAAERNMDLYNNEIGRALASGTTTRAHIANATLNALNSGQLITNPNSTSKKYDPISEITSAQNAINDAFNDMIASFGAEVGFTFNDGYTQEDFIALTDAMKELSQEIEYYVENNEYLTQIQKNELISQANNLEAIANNALALHYDPLVLDLDGDGIETVSYSSADANFDLFAGEGISASHGWVAPDDALLAIDKNSNGEIDDITELFGSAQVSGFEALTQHDENGDGVIDEGDAIFGDLLVWNDQNGDGVSQEGELRTLSDAGIKSINVSANEGVDTQNGNIITGSSNFTFADGTQSTISDVNFGVEVQSIQSNQSEDVFVFNDLSGSHNLNYFEDGLDTISLAGTSFNEFNIMDTGYGARVEVGDDFALNLQGINADQLTQDDFQFV